MVEDDSETRLQFLTMALACWVLSFDIGWIIASAVFPFFPV